MKAILPSVVATLGLLAFVSPAAAGLVTVDFEGVVPETLPSVSPVVDDFGLLPDVSPGDRFTGSYTYDDTVLAQVSSSGECLACVALYDFSGVALASIHLEINGSSFELDQSSGPTAGRFGSSGLSAQVHKGNVEFPRPRPPVSGDVFSITWSGSTSITEDRTEIIENISMIIAGFPAGTLLPGPITAAFDVNALGPLVVPDLSLAVTGFLAPLIVFQRRWEKGPDRCEPVAGEPGACVSIPGEHRESTFFGSLTSLALVPEPAAGALVVMVALALLAARR